MVNCATRLVFIKSLSTQALLNKPRQYWGEDSLRAAFSYLIDYFKHNRWAKLGPYVILLSDHQSCSHSWLRFQEIHPREELFVVE